MRSLCEVAASTASTEATTTPPRSSPAATLPPVAGCAVTAVLAWSIF